MSGIKFSTVTVSENVMRDLQARSDRLSYLESSLPEMQRNMQQHFEWSCEQLSRKTESRINAVNSRLSSLGKEMAEHERNFQKALRKQQDDFQRDMKNMGKAMTALDDKFTTSLQTLQRNMEASVKRLHEEVHTLSEENRRSMEALSDRVDRLEKVQDYARRQTRQWLDYARVQYDTIKNIPQFQRFFPGGLEDFARDMKHAEQDFSLGACQASLPKARDVAFGLNELRAKAESTIQTWERLRALAQSCIRQLLDEMESNRSIVAVGIDGLQIPEVSLDVNYWTEGDFTVLEETLQKEMEYFRSSDCPMDTQSLKGWLEEKPKAYHARIGALCSSARLAALLSQIRSEMGEEICSVFRTQGFVLDGADEPVFEDVDERKALLMDFVSRDKAHVAVRIVPDIKKFQNFLEVHSYDAATLPETQLRARQKNINAMLGRSLQLNISADPHEEKSADPAVRQAFQKAHSRLVAQGMTH